MSPTADDLIAALDDTWTALATVCEPLDHDGWRRPTGCPGWSVQDNVSHVIGLELELLGEPLPDHRLPDALAHVGNDIARHMEIAVDYRRGRAGADVLAELRDVTARRLQALRAAPLDLKAEAPGLFGRQSPLGPMLGIRVFDCWAHEQDVRRAVGARGGHDGAAGRIAWARMAAGLQAVLPGRVEALAERSVRFDVSGHGPVEVGAEGTEPAAVLSLDRDTFTALVCGRSDRGPVATGGDDQLASAVLAAAAFTP